MTGMSLHILTSYPEKFKRFSKHMVDYRGKLGKKTNRDLNAMGYSDGATKHNINQRIVTLMVGR